MSGRHFFIRQDSSFNTTYDNDNNDDEATEAAVVDNDEDDDDEEYLQDVPYSSSSVERSSIGSIPWADDAIKKNKLDWERVERMLCGAEELPVEETELRNEIIDWQRKFPQLLGRKAPMLKQPSYDSTRLTDSGDNDDSTSNLSLNSLEDLQEDDDDEDGFLTPTLSRQQAKILAEQTSKRKMQRPINELSTLMDRDLHITSVKLRQRTLNSAGRHQMPAKINTQFLASTSGAAPVVATNSATAMQSRLRMPPILNVLDTNRRFRGLLNNRSFVQLTQVQQQQQQRPQPHKLQQHQYQPKPQTKSAATTWHVAAFSSRFLNNRNAIVLPAIKREHVHHDFSRNTPHARLTTTTTTPSLSNSNSEHKLNGQHSTQSSLSSGHALGNRYTTGRQHNYALQQHYHGNGIGIGGLTSNSTTTPSTGRSISAAVHHARADYLTSAFYLPYSASKFKAFQSDLLRR